MKVITLFASLFLLLIQFGCSNKQDDKHPNVLIILTDDQGWGDVRSNGNDSISTPVLDQLARESVSFDRFYVSPVCAPTRASLLTGRYHLRTGTHGVTRRMEVMRSEEYTLAESFRDNGYTTACIGKWHNGSQFPNDPAGQGFDEFFGFKAGHWNNYFNTTLEHNNNLVKTEGYIADVLTDNAIGFIRANRENPFLCYLSYNTPHAPLQVPDQYFNKYKEMGFDDFTACIYGMCENIDDNTGRVLAVLDSLSLAENTIVIFLTDNGPNSWRYNGGMKGKKAHVDEGGVRVPFFIRYPAKLPSGKLVKQLGAHIDLFPTLHELCQIPIPDTLQLDGISLVPAMLENIIQDRQIFTRQGTWTFKPYPGSVRTPDYRLVINWQQDTLLYNMLDDPGQKHDISGQHPDITEQLALAYGEWIQDVTLSGINTVPVPVGFKEAPVVVMPAPEATLSGNLKYSLKSGWANDWIIDFQSFNDSCYWMIENRSPGTYQVTLELAVDKESVPCNLKVATSSDSQEYTIQNTLLAPQFESPDRVPRWEVYEREWPRIEIGEIYIQEGKQFISFKAANQSGLTGLELKSLIITKIK